MSKSSLRFQSYVSPQIGVNTRLLLWPHVFSVWNLVQCEETLQLGADMSNCGSNFSIAKKWTKIKVNHIENYAVAISSTMQKQRCGTLLNSSIMGWDEMACIRYGAPMYCNGVPPTMINISHIHHMSIYLTEAHQNRCVCMVACTYINSQPNIIIPWVQVV